MRVCRPFAVSLALAISARATIAQSRTVDLAAFTGTWKEDQSKSRVFVSGELTYTFSRGDDGFVTIERAGVGLRDRVRFDGNDYPTPADPSRTVSWSKLGDRDYETRIKRAGALLGLTRWTVATDGNRLTQETMPVRADGQIDTNITEYVRTAGAGDSLFGVWKPVSSRAAAPDLFVVTLVGDSALKVFYPKNRSSYTILPDGKEHEQAATNAPPGMTTAADALGQRSVRRRTLRDHAATFETVMTVSPDGHTMTVTTHPLGSRAEPSMFVYDKQE